MTGKKEIIEYVSKCCGAKTRIIIGIATGGRLQDFTICSKCNAPTITVLKGEEMRPIEGGIYCHGCAGILSGRIPKDLVLGYPASHDDGKGTCYGCGVTVRLQAASTIVKREKAE